MKSLILSLCVAVSLAHSTYAVTTNILGTANIYGAGHSVPPDPAGNSGGTLPTEIDFTPGQNAILTVTNVTGQVSLDVNHEPYNGADGGSSYTKTGMAPYGGISGVTNATTTMFLVGVFVNATEPADPAPLSLTYTSSNTAYSSYSPMLNQTFFIGDGLTGTGTGTVQQFFVPAGATRLFLGFADGFDGSTISGLPGYYFDNGGSLTADVVISGQGMTCPTLSVSNQITGVVLSWPASATNAGLQQTSVLNSNNWAAVTNTPVVVGTNFVVTNTFMPGQMFYRLMCH